VIRFREVDYVILKQWRLRARCTSIATDAGHALQCCGTISVEILLRAEEVLA